MAATTDRDIVAHLTNSNKQLVESNQSLTNQLKSALEANVALIKALGQNPTPKTPPITTPGGRKPFDYEKWKADLDPNGYCWTHGYRVTKKHNSKDCMAKHGGHKDEATRSNTMGGSTKNKPKDE
jgi:hypothetical protein